MAKPEECVTRYGCLSLYILPESEADEKSSWQIDYKGFFQVTENQSLIYPSVHRSKIK